MCQNRHFILHKPYGYLSQFIDNSSSKKKLLGSLGNFPESTMAIGRLDEKSEGLLLLTTDGKASEQIRAKHVEKEYYAQVDGLISNEAIDELQNGVEIGFDGKKYTTLSCSVFRLANDPGFPERSRKIRDDRHGPTSWLSITLTEGKFRQVRKMTAAVGFPTLRLVRVRIGALRMERFFPGYTKEVDSFNLTRH